VPIYAVPAPRYPGINSDFVNDEIEYTVTPSLTVGEVATATLTVRALSSGLQWSKLEAIVGSVTVPKATYGTPSHQPNNPDFTVLGPNTNSKVFSVPEIAKGQTLTVSVPFTPQAPGDYAIAFTLSASPIEKPIVLKIPVDVSIGGSSVGP